MFLDQIGETPQTYTELLNAIATYQSRISLPKDDVRLFNFDIPLNPPVKAFVTTHV